jgi:hypothetical protein
MRSGAPPHHEALREKERECVPTLSAVMRGRVPRIHVFFRTTKQAADARNEYGHMGTTSLNKKK